MKFAIEKRPLVMGIINVTPDSFYSRSRVLNIPKAIDQAFRFIDEGADIIDVGGESTRPGSKPVTVDEEIKRVIPVIEGIRAKSEIPLSVDTYKPEVAEKAIEAGANIVNDISGLRFVEGLAELVARKKCYIILMHIRGKPENMQKYAKYRDVIGEIKSELQWSIDRARKAGIKNERIIVDPGIGFAKNPYHNLLIIKNLASIKELGYPVLIGLSRKSFLGHITGLEAEERLIPTVAANAISLYNGADIIRVHDVREAVLTVKVVHSICSCS